MDDLRRIKISHLEGCCRQDAREIEEYINDVYETYKGNTALSISCHHDPKTIEAEGCDYTIVAKDLRGANEISDAIKRDKFREFLEIRITGVHE